MPDAKKRAEQFGQDVAAGGAAAGAGTYGAKKLSGRYALNSIQRNPTRLDKIISDYQRSRSGRRPLTPSGVYNSKFHRDPVKRKLNHGITHWEDAGGVKFQRKVAAGKPGLLTRLHPRYEEHKVLGEAIRRAPSSGTQLHRGVTMKPGEAKKLKKGQVIRGGTESWSDDAAKASKFATDKIKRDKKSRKHVPVTFRTSGDAKALNIQSQSNWNMSEWVSDKPYRIKKIKKNPEGGYRVKVKQVKPGSEVKQAAALARKAILANSAIRKDLASAGAKYTVTMVRASEKVARGGKKTKKLRKGVGNVLRARASYPMGYKPSGPGPSIPGVAAIFKSLEMPNTMPEPEERVERVTQIRLRDLKTGKFVAGPNPDLVIKGWGADSAARVANTARKAKIREGFKARAKAKERASWGEGYPGGMKRLDAEDDFARRSHRKSVNFVERFKMDSTGQRRLANPKYPTSPPRGRSLTGEDKRYLGLPGGKGKGTSQGVGARAQGGGRVDYQFTGNKRVRKDLQVSKSWKSALGMVGSGIAGGVVANQLPQNQRDSTKLWRKKKKQLPEPKVTLQRKQVEKSFVPGKGWVSATQVSRGALRNAAKNRPRWKAKMKRRAEEASDAAHGRAEAQQTQVRNWREGKPLKGVPSGHEPDDFTMLQMALGGTDAFTARVGGRRGGGVIVAPPGVPKRIVQHERAHLEPKRTAYRFRQVIDDPKKLQREEARADMAGGMYFRDPKLKFKHSSGYTRAARDEGERIMRENTWGNAAGAESTSARMWSQDAVAEYRQVQDKIASRSKKYKWNGNQYVTRDGQKRTGVTGGKFRSIRRKFGLEG